jgi:hypothetical protein
VTCDPSYTLAVTNEANVGLASSDDSPWRRDAGAEFDHADTLPFVVQSGDRDRDRLARSGADDVAQRSPDCVQIGDAEAPTGVWSHTDGDEPRETPGPGARPWMVGVGAVVVLGIVGGIVWTGARAELAQTIAEPGAAAEVANPAQEIDPALVLTRPRDLVIGTGEEPLVAPRTECLVQRLPSSLDLRWSAGLTGVRSVQSPVTLGAETVAAVVGVDTTDAEIAEGAALIALDVRTGSIRWRTGFELGSSDHRVVGISKGAVVVEQFMNGGGPKYLGFFDEMTGERVSLMTFESEWTASVDTVSGMVIVEVNSGSEVETVGAVGVFDPGVAEPGFGLEGELVSVEAGPVLVTLEGDRLLWAGEADNGVVLTGALETAQPLAVVDSAVVVAGFLAPTLSRLSDDAAPDVLMRREAAGAQIALPWRIDDLSSLGASAVLIDGAGSLYGTEIDEDSFDVRWRAEGVLESSVASDRGRVLLVGSSQSLSRHVIDGSTGRPIVDVPLQPGWDSAFTMMSNGTVVLRSGEGGPSRHAYDLDGMQLWTMPGTGPLAVGDRTVVTIEARSDPAGPGSEPIRLVAYGDDLGASVVCG